MKSLFIFFLFFSLNAFGQLITDKLIIYYPFSGNLLDHSGNGYYASGNATEFGTDHFSCENNALYSSNFYTSYNGYDTTFSCAFWIRIIDTNMSNVQISGRGPHFIINKDSVISSYYYTFGTYRVASVVALNEWVHVALTYSKAGNIGKLYVNGEVRQTAALNAYGAPMYMGAKGVHLDEVYYFNRVLSENEVKHLAIDKNSCLLTSVNDNNHRKDVLYPNPNFDGLVHIASEAKIIQAQVLDITGQVKEIYYGDNLKTIPMSSKGIIFLRLLSDQGTIELKSVTVY